MLSCSNCEAPIGGGLGRDDEALKVTHRGQVIVLLCGKCQETVTVAKIILKRTDTAKPFAYEGYAAPERER